jgi:hypothetical protein
MSGSIAKSGKPAAGAMAAAKRQIIAVNTPFKLVRDPGVTNLNIVWRINGKAGKRSAETPDPIQGKIKMDSLFAQTFGGPKICAGCGRGYQDADRPVSQILDEYWAAHGQYQDSPASIQTNLKYLRWYMATLPIQAMPNQIGEAWARDFRLWMGKLTYTKGKKGTPRPYAAATIESGLMQLHAALKWAKIDPQYELQDLGGLSRGPDFRADAETLAKMFRHCLYPNEANPKVHARRVADRVNLANYLRLAIARWGRPEAVLDFSLEPHRGQWSSRNRVVHLNPKGRAQGNKRRPSVPVPECVGAWLDGLPKEKLFKTKPTDRAWGRMMETAGCPAVGTGEAGLKLIRRTMAELSREALGEADWLAQGKAMLGHASVLSQSDTYAIPKPEYLGKALAFTAALIDQIEALCPGAFCPVETDLGANVIRIAGRG